MKSVAIISPTGMLGSMVFYTLKEKFELILVYRNQDKLKLLDEHYGDVSRHRLVQFDLFDIANDYHEGFISLKESKHLKYLFDAMIDVDYVINCAGITNRNSMKNPYETFFINSALPHILSSVFKQRLIHITTDCVFNGIDGAPYTEESVHSPNDLYGLSKSIGEPKDHSLVFRTSIIGPEISGHTLLVEWLRKQQGKTINGFTNHLWNGITTKAFAQICEKIMNDPCNYPSRGLFHIYSTSLSKFVLLNKLKEQYGIRTTIIPKEVNPIDRRLCSIYDVCQKLQIPTIEEMLAAL